MVKCMLSLYFVVIIKEPPVPCRGALKEGKTANRAHTHTFRGIRSSEGVFGFWRGCHLDFRDGPAQPKEGARQ